MNQTISAGVARLRFVAAALVACVSLALSTETHAQVAIGAALVSSTQEPGKSDRPYLGPGFGGTSSGSVIFFDFDKSPKVSVGVELSRAGNISGSQSQRVSGGTNRFVSNHHDTVIHGVVKVKPLAARYYHVAAVGGFGLAGRRTDRAGTYTPNNQPSVPTPMSKTLADTVLAATGGVDGAFLISRRVGILAVFRVHYLIDSDQDPGGVAYRGVSSVIVRYGAGVRLHF